jgi:hypothetical protein
MKDLRSRKPGGACLCNIDSHELLWSKILTASFFFFLQTTISLQFQPLTSIDRYELQWKLAEHEWSNPAGTMTALANGKPKIQAEAVNLTPGMTYCIRACCIDSSGAKGVPGPELIIDTEQVGCTPKAEKSCCIIQ